MQQSDGFFQTDQLYAGDTVIFVGEKKAKEAVERFVDVPFELVTPENMDRFTRR